MPVSQLVYFAGWLIVCDGGGALLVFVWQRLMSAQRNGNAPQLILILAFDHLPFDVLVGDDQHFGGVGGARSGRKASAAMMRRMVFRDLACAAMRFWRR
jgi:hypothetical protein